MAIRSGEAQWNDSLVDGYGIVKLGSGAFEGEYSFSSRFETGKGTNPEELIGAAHAACFSMALSAALESAGYKPEYVHTIARVYIDRDGDEFTIWQIELETEAKVRGIEKEKFLLIAEDAKRNCPVSRALAGTDIKLEAKLI